MSYIKINDQDFGSDEQAIEYVENNNCHEVKIIFQDGPIKENGVNGTQFPILISLAKTIISKLNAKFPCRENAIAIIRLEEALMWQESRTRDRIKRKVEGFNKE